MSNKEYIPPYPLTSRSIHLVSEISELVGIITIKNNLELNPKLRRENRIRTIHASLAIENNSLSLDNVTEIINGKRVLGNLNEIKEVKNAYEAYNNLLEYNPYSIEDMLEEVEIDDSRLEKVIKRIDAINKLKFKYGSTIVEIMTYRDEIQKKLSMIDFENDELDKLREKKKNLTKEYFEKSNLLSELRKKAGNMLEEKINEELKDLNMTAAQFKVEFTSREIIRNKGIDEVEFMMSTNVGEDIKPLAKIASGGEISRIMLALKTIFSEVDNISLLIFDEIDTGISGETVKKVASKLKKLSERVQVVCVTHSQQIAAKATQQ